ncbi:hypothetical protein GW813_13770 [bacterium]|nr:hypothetical protein [bacterium]
MNPGETPLCDYEAKAAHGMPCPACGSRNTSEDSILRPSPSIIFVIFFGWIFLLIRGAFAMRTSLCRDCGEARRYKSAGSWLAMCILILLLLIFILGNMEGGN